MGSHIACTKLCRIPVLLVRRGGEGGWWGGGGIEYKISVCTGSNYRIPHTCICTGKMQSSYIQDRLLYCIACVHCIACLHMIL